MKNEISWFQAIAGALVGNPAGAILVGVGIALLVQWRTGIGEIVWPWTPATQATPLWIFGALGGFATWVLILFFVIEISPRLLRGKQ